MTCRACGGRDHVPHAACLGYVGPTHEEHGLRARIAALTAERDDLTVERDSAWACTRILESARDEVRAERDVAGREQARLRDEICGLTAERDALRAENAELHRAALVARMPSLEATAPITEQARTVIDLYAERDALRARVAELEAEVERLRSVERIAFGSDDPDPFGRF